MANFYCKNHKERIATHQCSRCSKPLCEECYNPQMDACQVNCDADIPVNPRFQRPNPDGPQPRKFNWFLQVIVPILAAIGGLTLLLLAMCGAMLMGM
ncbi:hypothetical protein [Paenibacillus bovis]|uniref:B box-type domain-containing protein n=1 Tax=Paenibacillus bovis TaxID=1616788 RepID=A0A172ZHW6_9BACL|nr:hypothetical protein [Paenibacillus bovis]ANF97133.1 hypothetical protein AR543_14725 [Paenibacillus bovis]